MKLSVVIAAWDERGNVEALVPRLIRALDGMPGFQAELLFVVEGTDGTREALEALAARDGRIRVLYEKRPRGLGAAFRRGFAALAPDVDLVVTMDADLNHQPEEIPRLVAERERTGADILVGSRFVPGARSAKIPLWKRSLSGIMNRVIGVLFGVPVADKTSGFRVYRGAALRALSHVNDDFAFLPELLVNARAQGFRMAEAPIHFVFRETGRSKMAFWRTIVSYLRLLASRVDRFGAAALAALLAGTALRLLVCYPVHKYAADADATLTGFQALDILKGARPAFYSGVRIGSLESYVHAAVFALAGPSRQALSVAPFLAGVLSCVLYLLIAREVVGRRLAPLALLFFSLPAPAFLFWTYMPNGYPETVLLGLLVVLLTLRARHAEAGVRLAVLLGLAAGLGFWNSLQVVGVLLPCFVWLFLERSPLLRTPRLLATLLLSFAAGALPWLAYNALTRLGSLRWNIATEPVPSWAALRGNAVFAAGRLLPRLVLGDDPAVGTVTLSGLAGPLAAATLVAALAGLAVTGRRSLRRSGFAAVVLLLAIAATSFLLTVVSAPGSVRIFTERYVLYAFFVVPVALALFLSEVSRRSRVLAGALAIVVLLWWCRGWYLPGTAPRKEWDRARREDDALLAELDGRGVRAVVGRYWTAFPVNFLSTGRIVGIPYRESEEHYRVRARVRPRVRWALVTRTAEELASVRERLGAEGSVVTVPGYLVFIPSDGTPLDRPRLAAIEKGAGAFVP